MTSFTVKTTETLKTLKLLGLPLLLATSIAATSPAAASMTPEAATPADQFFVIGQSGLAPDTPPIAIETAQPRYPYIAAEKNEEGWVIVKMDIDAHGVPFNASVIDADAKRVFYRTSLNAVKKFRFAPATLDGQPVAVTGKHYKISYALLDG